MSSGIYSTLSGNLARMQALDSIVNNLANANTVGFKKDRLSFESLLSGTGQTNKSKGLNFTRLQNSFIDFSSGNTQITNNALDLAIEGEGFFKVRRGDDFLYTRAGNFHLDPDGTLMTESGLAVVDSTGQPITIPNHDFSIDEEGRIMVEEGEAGRINIFMIDDPGGMTKEGGCLFKLPSGQQDRVTENAKVRQGHLETSNVNMLEEMALMMEGLRAFEAHQKMMKSYGTIGSKLDDLGSL